VLVSALMELAQDRGDLRRRRTICVVVLALGGLYSLLLIPAVPSLLGSDPVLLEALRGSIAAMVAGGAFARIGEASLVLALLAPLPTLMMMDPFIWWAGRLWGPDVAQYLGARGPRGRRRMQRALRFLERFGSVAVLFAYILPVPSALIYAAAGWTGMRLRRFLLLDLAGTVLWVALIVGLGYAIGRSAVQVAHDITHYSLLLTLALVVVVAVVAVVRAIAQARGDESLSA
jgi:membrane-associated protein